MQFIIKHHRELLAAKMRLMLSLLLLLLGCLAADATTGVDVSSAVSTDTWSCIVSNGYSFACVRIYRQSGVIDSNGAQTIINARAGGVSYVDGYIFPCFPCGNPGQQVADAINNLNANGAIIGGLWLDIEDSTAWGSSCDANVDFIQGMVDEANSLGIVVGIYTSNSQWTPIACSSTAFSNLPLWYAHYDNNPSFSDFVPFGGWTQPNIKQYEGNVDLCSAYVDFDFY